MAERNPNEAVARAQEASALIEKTKLNIVQVLSPFVPMLEVRYPLRRILRLLLLRVFHSIWQELIKGKKKKIEKMLISEINFYEYFNQYEFSMLALSLSLNEMEDEPRDLITL